MPVEAENPPRLSIEPFEPGRHERAEFSCGVARLDNFLRLSARKQQKDDFTRAFVAVAEGSPTILGYYALNTHAVGIAELGRSRPRRVPGRASLPAVYLSMIAVDKSQQGSGLGTDLLIDALLRACRVSMEVGLKLVILDVIDDGGETVFRRRKEFYRLMGFENFSDHPQRMFMTIGTIRSMFPEV
ncbi:MAG: GNAT family N-acetyltransferase [Gammaproteobacteria bacterium]|nr:GNAT family N-acetyltransferase [Chromatiales bacterium]MYE48162.1 GNAT family N-acetyltransferase [Gammaproteobacteria bacterium]